MARFRLDLYEGQDSGEKYPTVFAHGMLIDEQEIISRLKELAGNIRSTTGRAGDVDLRTNQRLNERSTVEANQLLAGRYAIQEA